MQTYSDQWLGDDHKEICRWNDKEEDQQVTSICWTFLVELPSIQKRADMTAIDHSMSMRTMILSPLLQVHRADHHKQPLKHVATLHR